MMILPFEMLAIIDNPNTAMQKILLEGRPIEEYGRKEFARTAAFLPQNRSVPGITVRALVSLQI